MHAMEHRLPQSRVLPCTLNSEFVIESRVAADTNGAAAEHNMLRSSTTILILCGGPNTREHSLFNLFEVAGFECVNYDLLNVP